MKTRHINYRLKPYEVSVVDLPKLERTVQMPNGAIKSVDELELSLRVLRGFQPADGIDPGWHYRLTPEQLIAGRSL